MSFLNHPHFTHPSRAVVIAETIALLLLLSILGLDEAFTLLNQPSNSAVFFGVVILATLGGIYVTVGARVWRYIMTRRTLVVVLVTFTAVSLAGCGARVNPGYVGIKVNYYGYAILAQSLSPSLIQWRQLDLTEKSIARWNGVRPLVEGQASGLLLNVPTGGRQ